MPSSVFYKDAVAAVFAPTHDKIGAYSLSSGRRAKQNAAPRIGAFFQISKQIGHAISLPSRRLGQLFGLLGQEQPFGLLHHAALQRFGRVAGEHLHGLLRQNRPAVGNLVDDMHRRARHLHATRQRRLVHAQPVVPLAAEGGDQAGVHVQYAALIGADHARVQNEHEARQHHHIDAVGAQQRNQPLAVARRASRRSRARARRIPRPRSARGSGRRRPRLLAHHQT